MKSARGGLAGAHRLACDSRGLSMGWELACDAEQTEWVPARVPGTAAAALRDAGLWRDGDRLDFDGGDWSFRTRFDASPAGPGEQLVLAFDGIATVAEVHLNGEPLLRSESMFASHEVDVSGRLRAENELVIRCKALGPLLEVRRRPRARWRTKLVTQRNLRFFRTMLLGRAPGFAPCPAAVGPWKPVRLERRRTVAVDELRLRPSLEHGRGRLDVAARLRALSRDVPIERAAIELEGPTGVSRAELAVVDGEVRGELSAGEVEPWWPHTHGVPALYQATLFVTAGGEKLAFDAGRLGFRRLEVADPIEREGIQLRINGVRVFARGAVWTPPDLACPCSEEPELRRVLEAVVACGMNMLRVPGTACYEGEAFYDLCDELGILVWQDFMFANFDYPEQDEAFMGLVREEARAVLAQLGARPSLSVLCGGSEVAQQVAMLGLDPQLAHGPLYGEALPAAVAEARVQAPYVPSAPWGGALPFRPGAGVTNYFGVGAYLRPLEDARRAEVRFAAECLAFANVPDEDALEALEPGRTVEINSPRWKAGVPRDAGAGWDFDDVRDHYLGRLYGVDPAALRSTDPERYLELSRSVTGEVMAEVLGEWRRARSPCGGALVLWLTDVVPGAGWGLLDHRGEPKVAYHYLRRALAPIAVWSTDEGLGGIAVHAANDQPQSLVATLRIALYRNQETLVDEVRHPLILEGHSVWEEDLERLLGRFVDASWAYRFGPPAQDLIVLSLESEDGLLAQSVRFPAGRPVGDLTADALGLEATLESVDAERVRLLVRTRRLAYSVRIHVPGFMPDDNAFALEPGRWRGVDLLRVASGPWPGPPAGHLTAMNLIGRFPLRSEDEPV